MMGAFLAELRRRSVFKVGIAYAIVAWLLVQVTVAVEKPLHLPVWIATFVIFLLAIGFPVALLLAWAFELTPEGVKRAGPMAQRSAAGTSDPAAESPAPTPAAAAQSIAVLPFVDMSPDKDQEYFSDGISEELLNQLAKIKDLHVAGRTSSFSFKGRDDDLRVIGEKLNVAHVLEGSIRKAGNRVRVTAQLIKAADGYHLWSESYDRELDDIFAIQDDIARAVTNALSITLGVGNLGVSTRNIAAYEAYLAGRSLYNQGGRQEYLQAIEQLEQAVAEDPQFAEAWGMLAITYYNGGLVYVSERASEYLEKFQEAATRAIALGLDSVAPLCAAATLENRNRNWSKAEQLLKKAIALAPSDYLANTSCSLFLKNVGRVREGLEYDQRGAGIEPLVVTPAVVLGVSYEVNGDLDAALKEFQRGQGLIGDRGQLNGVALATALTKGDHALAEEILQKHMNDDTLPPANRDITTTMQANLDDPEAARAALHRFYENPAYNNPFVRNVISVWSAYFNDYELALKIQTEAVKSGSFVVYAIWRPIFKPMRQLPAFKQLLQEAGLVDYWLSTGNWGDFCRPVGNDDFECIK